MRSQAVVGSQGDVLARVLAAVPSPVSLWRLIDGDFRLVDVNESGAAYLGKPRDELIGLSSEAAGGNSARIRRDMRRALSSGKSVTRDGPYVTGDGDVHQLHVTYVPLAPGHVLAFGEDTTQEQRAQEQLRISQSRYETIVNASPHGIWLVDQRGRTTFTNGRVGHILGQPADVVVRSNLLDFVDLRDRASVAGALECPRDAPESFEARFRHGQGHELLCLLSVRPVAAPGSAPVTLCTLADMTALQHERELRAAGEKRFRRMVETASEGIWTGDAAGRTTFVNEAAARMVGLHAADLIGRPFSDFLADHEQGQAVRAEVEGTQDAVRAEFRLVHAEGRPVDVIASMSLLRNDEGVAYGSLAMVTDVTELKRERENLRESRQRFAQVFEEAPVGMVFVGAGHLAPGRFLGANRAFLELLGYTEEELLGHDLLSLTHPQDVDTERELADDLFQRRRDNYELEKRFLRADGEVIWVRFRVGVLRDLRGAPLYGLGVAVDISEQKRAGRAAVAAEARMAALLDSTRDALLEVDGDGVIVGLSEPAEHALGRSRERTVGLHVSDVLEPGSGERTVVADDGSRLIFLEDNAIHDRAAAAREEAQARFERLFRDGREPVLLLDRQGKVTDANEAFCRFVARQPSQVLGRYAGELLAPTDDADGAPWADPHAAAEPITTPRRVSRGEGGTATVNVTVSGVPGAGGEVVAWICQCTPRGLAAASAVEDGEPLSYRERQVLSLLAHGLDGPQIAERLGLAQETVRSYTQSARAKCGAKTRTEAVALALARGDITL